MKDAGGTRCWSSASATPNGTYENLDESIEIVVKYSNNIRTHSHIAVTQFTILGTSYSPFSTSS